MVFSQNLHGQIKNIALSESLMPKFGYYLTENDYLTLVNNSSDQNHLRDTFQLKRMSDICENAHNGDFWQFLAIFRVENGLEITLLVFDT